MIDLDELRKKAEAATKGPWRWTKVDYGRHYSAGTYEEQDDAPFDALWSDDKGVVVFAAQDASSYAASCDFPNDGDASFIASANPSVVLELIDEIERLRRENTELAGEYGFATEDETLTPFNKLDWRSSNTRRSVGPMMRELCTDAKNDQHRH